MLIQNCLWAEAALKIPAGNLLINILAKTITLQSGK